MDKQNKESIINAVNVIKNSEALLIVTGAGMGIDSGLPDYRGPNGLWNTWHPAKELNMTYEKLSTHENFLENPELAWGFQTYLTRLYHELDPHQGYYDLLKIATKNFNNNYFIITSNVDSQFLKSGFDPLKLYEVHGTKRLWQCIDKNCNKLNCPWLFNIDQLPKIDSKTLLALKPLPKCKYCGKLARPNVSFFGDFIFNESITKVQSERLFNWIQANKNKKLVIMEMGCGISVHSIRFKLKGEQYTMLSNEWKLPKSFLSKINTNLIRINPDNDEEQSVIKVKLGAKLGISLIKKKLDNN